MIKLEPFSPSHFDTLIAWIDNEELLVTIAGSVFTYPLTAEQLHIYLAGKNSHSFNIVDTFKGTVIGHAEILLSGAGLYKIDKLIIGDQSNRGKGIGQAVINELLAYAFNQLGAHTVELNVFDWNIAGIKCYEKCGFVIDLAKQVPFRVGDKHWVAFNMTIERDSWERRSAAVIGQ